MSTVQLVKQPASLHTTLSSTKNFQTELPKTLIKMKFALALLVIVAVAAVCKADYQDPCTSSNDPMKDDAACVGTNNNMLCNPQTNTCLCKDKYPGQNDGKTYAPAPDKKSCMAQ